MASTIICDFKESMRLTSDKRRIIELAISSISSPPTRLMTKQNKRETGQASSPPSITTVSSASLLVRQPQLVIKIERLVGVPLQKFSRISLQCSTTVLFINSLMHIIFVVSLQLPRKGNHR